MLVFEVEAALPFFYLILIVNYFKNAGTQLSPYLAKHAVSL
jgi:hypothetical protein